MDRWRQINRMAFHLAACLLPAYNRCLWGNKVKNVFAKHAFSHVGEAVNWGKNVLICVDFIFPELAIMHVFRKGERLETMFGSVTM